MQGQTKRGPSCNGRCSNRRGPMSSDEEGEDAWGADDEMDDDGGGFGDEEGDGLERAEAEQQHLGVHADGREEAVVIHIDVDSFYVTCERIRRPDLEGKPVAVSQFNRGGFVAVSYEARARGVRKGDGIGEVGQRELKWFQDRPEAVMKEVRKRCPELVVLLMDMPWYRTVHDRIHAALEALFPVVQRNSLDDFYVTWRPNGEGGGAVGGDGDKEEDDGDAYARTKLAHRPDDPPLPPSRLHPPLYAAAARVATRARQVLKETLNVSASCGIGPNKLLARLASAAAGAKPNGQGLLSPDPRAINEVLGALPLSRIPGLQQQRGERLAAMVMEKKKKKGGTNGESVTLLDVRRWLPRPALVEAFGESVGAWIHAAALGRDAGKGVFTRPPPQTLIVEASFNQGVLTGALLEPLAKELLRRLLEDSGRHRRVPTSLLVRYRLDYDKVASRSTRLPRPVTSLLSGHARSSGGGAPDHPSAATVEGADSVASPPSSNAAGPPAAPTAGAVAAVVEAALELLRKHLPPALLVVAAPSSSSSQQQQQQQAQQRLTRVVLGVSGFQEAAAPLHGSIMRFLGSSGAKAGGGGAGGGGGQPPPPPPSPSAAAATRDDRQHAAVVGGSNGNSNNDKGREAQEELPPALRAAGYDPEVWRALPDDVRRELLLASPQGGQLLPLPVPVPSSTNKRAAAPGVGGRGGGKRSKSSPPKRKSTGGGKAAAPLTRFFKPKGTAGGKEG